MVLMVRFEMGWDEKEQYGSFDSVEMKAVQRLRGSFRDLAYLRFGRSMRSDLLPKAFDGFDSYGESRRRPSQTSVAQQRQHFPGALHLLPIF